MPDVIKVVAKPPTRRFSNDIKEVPCTEVIDTSPPDVEKAITAQLYRELLADPYSSLSEPFKASARKLIAEVDAETEKQKEKINAE